MRELILSPLQKRLIKKTIKDGKKSFVNNGLLFNIFGDKIQVIDGNTGDEFRVVGWPILTATLEKEEKRNGEREKKKKKLQEKDKKIFTCSKHPDE